MWTLGEVGKGKWRTIFSFSYDSRMFSFACPAVPGCSVLTPVPALKPTTCFLCLLGSLSHQSLLFLMNVLGRIIRACLQVVGTLGEMSRGRQGGDTCMCSIYFIWKNTHVPLVTPSTPASTQNAGASSSGPGHI